MKIEVVDDLCDGISCKLLDLVMVTTIQGLLDLLILSPFPISEPEMGEPCCLNYEDYPGSGLLLKKIAPVPILIATAQLLLRSQVHHANQGINDEDKEACLESCLDCKQQTKKSVLTLQQALLRILVHCYARASQDTEKLSTNGEQATIMQCVRGKEAHNKEFRCHGLITLERASL
jgi:hypothetical protein